MDKKIGGACAAAIGAMLYGGAQLMGMEERIQALEEMHPEMAQEKANAAAEDLKETSSKTPEPTKSEEE